MSSTESPPPAAVDGAAHAAGGAAADAFAALVRAHQRGVWRFLRALGCAPAVADELTADVFVVAHDKQLATGAVADVAAFLRGIARILWLRRQRQAGRERERFAAAAEALWQRDCARDDGEELLDALRACVETLDGRAAAAIAMCYGDELPHAEVATRLGLRTNGLRTLLHRVRGALRECVRRRLSWTT